MLAIPGIVGSAAEPLVGVLGDTHRRRALVLVGGVLFALSAALTSLSIGFWTLLVALVIGNPATSAFVSLSQATLVDLAPARREQAMAWWTLAGSLGYVGGPLLLVGGIVLGVGWRGVVFALALLAIALTVAAGRLSPAPAHGGQSVAKGLRRALAAVRDRGVLRWLFVLKASDLLLDVFHGFLALYFVDVVGATPAEGALAVGVWTGAGLVGDALLIPLLRRVPGRTYLRLSALGALAVYPAFLLVDDLQQKLVLVGALGLLNSGWYAIPKAGLYEALPGRSGAAVAVSGFAGIVHAGVPALLGTLAGAVGLGATMWVLIAAPLALLLLLPRR